MRLSAVSEQFISQSPDELLTGARYITEFGGVTGVLIVLSLAFWLGPRQEVLTLFGIVTAGLVVIVTLKEIVAMPRPPEEMAAITPTDPYGFPSGHAFSAMMTYGGLAAVFGWLRSLPRLALVMAFIGAVALSRVILGVHYLGDVIGGLIVGAVFLAVMLWLTADRPNLAFGIALLCLPPAFVLVETTVYIWTALGIAVGGFSIAMLGVDRLPVCTDWIDCGIVIGAGGILLVGVQQLTAMVSNGPLLAGVFAAGFGGLLATPVLLWTRSDRRTPESAD